jgi:hypothetical protein
MDGEVWSVERDCFLLGDEVQRVGGDQNYLSATFLPRRQGVCESEKTHSKSKKRLFYYFHEIYQGDCHKRA